MRTRGTSSFKVVDDPTCTCVLASAFAAQLCSAHSVGFSLRLQSASLLLLFFDGSLGGADGVYRYRKRRPGSSHTAPRRTSGEKAPPPLSELQAMLHRRHTAPKLVSERLTDRIPICAGGRLEPTVRTTALRAETTRNTHTRNVHRHDFTRSGWHGASAKLSCSSRILQ